MINNRIKEDYCSFEICKLLAEKGFDEICFACYEYFSSNVTMFSDWSFEYKGDVTNSSKYRIKCPTHQMALKWLREVHNIYIEICIDRACNFNGITFRPAIYDKELDCLWESDNFSTYEEAVKAALKYCLEKLI